MKQKFPLGRIVATPGAIRTITPADVTKALSFHASGDWGNVPEEDKRANDHALQDGTRLLSSYTDSKGTRFWIITEADRSVTTILLPEEY